MQPALLIRLRPAGPWRYGPGDGALDRTDTLFRSDRLYSAVTLAMQRLDLLDEWLRATVGEARPAVTFSSLFPFQADTLFAIPPAHVWPPPPLQITAPNPVFVAKIRWKAARFVPLHLIDTLVTGGAILADQWLPEAETGCLLRRDRPNASPFRMVVRTAAPVDRVTAISTATTSAGCVEFEPNAGLWTLVRYADDDSKKAWDEPLRAAFRLLADSGFGGRRTNGWGHAEAPEFEPGVWPRLLLPKLQRRAEKLAPAETGSEANTRFWLLSLYSPAASDAVDWRSGSYTYTMRAGRVENGGGEHPFKKSLRMVTEGSVLVAATEPTGVAVDVAPDGFAHPVYRSGLALALELPAIDFEHQIRDIQAADEPLGVEGPQGSEPAPLPAAESTEVPTSNELAVSNESMEAWLDSETASAETSPDAEGQRQPNPEEPDDAV